MSDSKKRKMQDSDSDSGSEEAPPSKNKKNASGNPSGNWRQGLRASMDDPKSKVFGDEHVIVIKDKYPKARYHFLVMPKEKIDGLHQLTAKHVDLLEKMKEAGKDVASENLALNQFRCGFHARPSMTQLHMHVISQDFDSPALKTKKHWNSFTTAFFRDVDDVLNELKQNGKIAPANASECEAMMKQPLKCHICKEGRILPTIPKLKEHLKKHERQNPEK